MTTYAIPKRTIPGWVQVMPMAMAVTFGLFILMERLISMEYPVAVEEPTVPLPEVHWKEPPVVEVINKKVEKPMPPEHQPPSLPEPQIRDNPTGIQIPKVAVLKEVPTGTSGMGYRMPVPQVMVSPKYPMSAINREIEGYVDVKFDITENGVPENIAVLNASPEGVFETSAISAVSRWRYLPQLDDGKPVPFHGMTQRLRFEMGKQ